jgi:hypothetical protein
VALKAAKRALVGPVLSACGGQEGGLSDFSDSLSRETVRKPRRALAWGPTSPKTGRKGPVLPLCASQMCDRDVTQYLSDGFSRETCLKTLKLSNRRPYELLTWGTEGLFSCRVALSKPTLQRPPNDFSYSFCTPVVTASGAQPTSRTCHTAPAPAALGSWVF